MKISTIALTALLAVSAATAASAAPSGDWSTAQKLDEIDGNHPEVNTPSVDGCPILSPDGRTLYMASNRPGGHGGLDIWVARRERIDEPFGRPENLPAPVNSAANDFCPTPLRGKRLLFVSTRATAESCGMGDIYVTREDPKRGWRAPRHLDCTPAGPNTARDEQGPSLVEIGGEEHLFFSTSAPGVPGDIFVSRDFGPGTLVAELSTAGNDIQPNVRKNGLEVVLSSQNAQGNQDIYAATRASTDDPWSAPVNLGPAINTAANETRPSFSWDGRTLLFGRAPGPEGMADIYVSTR
jgi:hypothetical protein